MKHLTCWFMVVVLITAVIVFMHGMDSGEQAEVEAAEAAEAVPKEDPAEAFARMIAGFNPDKCPYELARQVVESSVRWAGDNWYEVALDVVAMGAVESGWDTRVKGTSGEIGPLQVKPSTALDVGIRGIEDWRIAVEAGVKYYVTKCQPLAKGEMQQAVAFYNAGISRSPEKAARLASRHVGKVVAARSAIVGVNR
jgi:hypothetical protein